MIKVNLLATSPGAAPPREWFPREQRAALAGFALLFVTATSMAGWWIYLDRSRTSINARIASDQTELTHLKDAARLVDETTSRRTELAERLGLIDRLQAAKKIPVTLLETISKSITDGLWLLSFKQQGNAVVIEGRAMSITAVTDFAERMQNSGVFERPVDITTTTDMVEQESVVRFQIRADTVDHNGLAAGDAADSPKSGATPAAGAPKSAPKPAPKPLPKGT